jgi:hypothetical protein
MGCECMDWIQLALGRIQWQALVNTLGIGPEFIVHFS